MGSVSFENRRSERVGVLIVKEAGRSHFSITAGKSDVVKCEDGETIRWGWFPWEGAGEPPLGDADCPVTDGDPPVQIRNDCKLE